MVAVRCLEKMMNGELPDTRRKVLFLLGGAGTGKAAVIRYLSERMGPLANIVAYTGIAAKVLGCTTIHSAFGFSIENAKASNTPELEDAELRALVRIWEKKRPLIIDEISMVSKEFLDAMDQRLQDILGNKDYMGGLILLAVGDFYQIRSMRQSALKKKKKMKPSMPSKRRRQPWTLYLLIRSLSYIFSYLHETPLCETLSSQR